MKGNNDHVKGTWDHVTGTRDDVKVTWEDVNGTSDHVNGTRNHVTVTSEDVNGPTGDHLVAYAADARVVVRRGSFGQRSTARPRYNRVHVHVARSLLGIPRVARNDKLLAAVSVVK
jgi:hypothetical protein